MQKLFAVCLILILGNSARAAGGYDMNTPLLGDSIASDSLQFTVVKDLYSILSSKMPYCFDYYISDTQIVHYPYDVKKKKGKYIKGYWKELWSVNACGKIIQVPLTFYIDGKNTDYFFDVEPDIRN